MRFASAPHKYNARLHLRSILTCKLSNKLQTHPLTNLYDANLLDIASSQLSTSNQPASFRLSYTEISHSTRLPEGTSFACVFSLSLNQPLLRGHQTLSPTLNSSNTVQLSGKSSTCSNFGKIVITMDQLISG